MYKPRFKKGDRIVYKDDEGVHAILKVIWVIESVYHLEVEVVVSKYECGFQTGQLVDFKCQYFDGVNNTSGRWSTELDKTYERYQKLRKLYAKSR